MYIRSVLLHICMIYDECETGATWSTMQVPSASSMYSIQHSLMALYSV